MINIDTNIRIEVLKDNQSQMKAMPPLFKWLNSLFTIKKKTSFYLSKTALLIMFQQLQILLVQLKFKERNSKQVQNFFYFNFDN